MNPFHSVKEGSLLEDAVSILKTGVKRVPILNSENRVSGLISQASLNKYFVSHVNKTNKKEKNTHYLIIIFIYRLICSKRKRKRALLMLG